MSMKKAFDQTIRDLKREVNKKVRKVPSIEQKVLDATSNEPWGPLGSLLADIAQASRNYNEYHMIMAIIWKRINDTGKNWRHVYKALAVLEYLAAHGSERVIEEIREHAYQISTLSDFQYIDSSGRDQGNNVRRKSQSLVLLVNDKERVKEVRQKAAANRDKFRNASSTGGMYRPGGYGDRYDDDHYEGCYGRDDERNRYGREREEGFRDDDRYGWYVDSYGREGERHGRDSEERYGRESYRDDDMQHGSRGRSFDRDRDRACDDDDRHSSRGSSVKEEDHPWEGSSRGLERKFSEQNLGAPPSYKEAVGGSRSPAYSERDGVAPAAPVPKSSSAPAVASPSHITADPGGSYSHQNQEADTFEEFDPRGSAAPGTSSNGEMDLLGSLSDSLALAITPVSSAETEPEVNAFAASSLESTFVATNSTPNAVNQSFEDPFGDSPFKAVPSDELPAQTLSFASMSSSQPTLNSAEQAGQVVQKVDAVTNSEFANTFQGLTFNSTNDQSAQFPLPNQQFMPQQPPLYPNYDILAGILPPSGPLPPTVPQKPFHTPTSQLPPQTAFLPITQQSPQTAFLTTGQPQHQTAFLPIDQSSQQTAFLSTGQTAPPNGNFLSFIPQSGPAGPGVASMAPQTLAMPTVQHVNVSSLPQSASASVMASNASLQMTSGLVTQQNDNFLDNFRPQAGPNTSFSSPPTPSFSAGSVTVVSQLPSKDKFETKSTVWADTLTRGLVDLNISGPKTNPLADIGVDFESLNRKEKRTEKPAATPVVSTVTMGKAMGSGSGIGRAGASALRASENPMMGSGMNMGMGMGGGHGGGMGMGMGLNMGMGGYYGMNQAMGRGTSMGMGQNTGMGMGMMGQGPPLQPMNLMPPGYSPTMGGGGYTQQPYGGGYR
ncbi:hypothetical protein Ancab_032423 [Ancistrocladus abbreviatus]